MKILLNDNGFNLLVENLVEDAMQYLDSDKRRYKGYSAQIAATKETLSKLIKNGRKMYNIDNGKIYKVYYDASLSNSTGKGIGICALLKDNDEIYGALYAKPMALFKAVE